MEEHAMWVIKGPGGTPLMRTLAFKRSDAIDKIRSYWRHYYRMGYRAHKVRVRMEILP